MTTSHAQAATPSSFWTYQSKEPTPSLEDAIACGAIKADTTPMEWSGFSPGMRRTIVGDYLRRTVR